MNLQRTALFELHQRAGGKMGPFAGWEMPFHYGSQVEEHHAVRQSAGMFDVSHMLVVDLEGDESSQLLQKLVANDASKLKKNGAALYTAMLNEQGGILDDLIIYKMGFGYRLVVNCGTREQDLSWIEQVQLQGKFDGITIYERSDLSIIAVQGPESVAKMGGIVGDQAGSQLIDVERFNGMVFNRWFIGRTGYTGEDGVEIMLPHSEAIDLWQQLQSAGVVPCGLGARDTLRLEAGMNLYGQDMDPSVTPLESNIGWTVDWTGESRDFIGRAALQAQRTKGVSRKLIGLEMKGRGVLRADQKVMLDGQAVGVTTSGGFSPTLGTSIAFARVQASAAAGDLSVEIRGKLQPVALVKPPFVRR